MAMAPDLNDLFEREVLIRPSPQKANLVSLIRAVAALSGVSDVPVGQPAQELMAVIGPAEHLIFVLLDGLGMNLVRRLAPESFLARTFRRELLATCPSTTACALTSLATAEHPNRHGVTGWFTHLPNLNLTATVLPFTERFTGQLLTQRGIRVEDVLPLPVLVPRIPRRTLTVVPAPLANTAYNTYSRGGTPGYGYHSIQGAIDALIAHVNAEAAPSYAHLYLPEVDSLCHKLGADHPNVVPLVSGISIELERLFTALGGRARMIVSADHGLIDVPRENQALLFVGDPLVELLAVPPSGDARMPVFHVKSGHKEAFAELFHERFDDRMVLLETDEAERMQLFGPGPIAPPVRNRFGDFVAIPYKAATLAFHPPGKPVGELFLAVHAGLSPQEMRVPLCVT
jgi:hypothetical protein